MEANKRKQNFLGDNTESQLILLTDAAYPRINVTYGGADESRPATEIDVEQFIAVKGFKAKGKRISTWQIAGIEELEPTRWPEETETETDTQDNDEPELDDLDPDAGKSQQQVIDEMTGQLNLFPEEEN